MTGNQVPADLCSQAVVVEDTWRSQVNTVPYGFFDADDAVGYGFAVEVMDRLRDRGKLM